MRHDPKVVTERWFRRHESREALPLPVAAFRRSMWWSGVEMAAAWRPAKVAIYVALKPVLRLVARVAR